MINFPNLHLIFKEFFLLSSIDFCIELCYYAENTAGEARKPA
jgi:hypothetical protein